MAKRPVIPVESLSADTQKFYDTLNESSDLAVVLVTASYLDASLASLLHRYFVESSVSDKLLDANGTLGTIASRADAAYALGLIDKRLYQGVTKITEIRNQFAHHHLEHSFKVPEIGKLCGESLYIDSLNVRGGEAPIVQETLSDSRNRFVLHAVMISQRLLLNGLGVKRRSHE